MTAIARRVTEWITAIADRYSLVGIGLDAFGKFNAHEAMPRAAAIAYYSILSLFPCDGCPGRRIVPHPGGPGALCVR